MNLYLVRCVNRMSREHTDVYVVAKNPSEAEEKAISEMEKLDWKYKDEIEYIELLASEDPYKSRHVFVR